MKFLKEESIEGLYDYEDIARLCPKSFVEFHGKPLKLYRGMELDEDFLKIIPRNDRRPLSSSKIWHEALNNAFKTVFGVPLRTSSVFCTGDEDQASDYGEVYEIYPSNDYQVYWSGSVDDSVLLDYSDPDYPMAAIAVNFCSYPWNRGFEGFANTLNRANKLKLFLEKELTEKLEEAFKTKNASILALEVLKKFPNCVSDFVRQNYKKGNVQTAIKCQNEIMVTCSYYCAAKK